MVDPNRKINRLSDDDTAFLRECEQEFRNRFTEDDEEFAKLESKPLRPPPIIEQWQTGRRPNQHYGGGSSGYGNNSSSGGWRNNSNYYRNRDGNSRNNNYHNSSYNNHRNSNDNYGHRPPRNHHYRNHQNRVPYDRNFRHGGYEGGSGGSSSRQ